MAISVFWLLGGLALSTIPVALAGSLGWLVVLLFVCGVLCAPTITATVDHLSRLVPERSRGEAMGWHGSAMTAGQAIGAPLAGYAIDHRGFGLGHQLRFTVLTKKHDHRTRLDAQVAEAIDEAPQHGGVLHPLESRPNAVDDHK